jgi:hypothetical protein
VSDSCLQLHLIDDDGNVRKKLHDACIVSGSSDKGLYRLKQDKKKLREAAFQNTPVILIGSIKEETYMNYVFMVSCPRPALMYRCHSL